MYMLMRLRSVQNVPQKRAIQFVTGLKLNNFLFLAALRLAQVFQWGGKTQLTNLLVPEDYDNPSLRSSMIMRSVTGEQFMAEVAQVQQVEHKSFTTASEDVIMQRVGEVIQHSMLKQSSTIASSRTPLDASAAKSFAARLHHVRSAMRPRPRPDPSCETQHPTSSGRIGSGIRSKEAETASRLEKLQMYVSSFLLVMYSHLTKALKSADFSVVKMFMGESERKDWSADLTEHAAIIFCSQLPCT